MGRSVDGGNPRLLHPHPPPFGTFPAPRRAAGGRRPSRACAARSQVASASSLYGVKLENMCKAYSGSPEISNKESFTVLINSVMASRRECLSKPTQSEIMACCQAKTLAGKQWYQSGICAKPWLWKDGKGFSLTNSSGLSLQESMELFTSILGDFIGISQPFHYGLANAEFYCKNCPNDFRKNCPFDPPKGEIPPPGQEELCDCPGGELSRPGQPFWAMSSDQAAGKYVLCSDQAKVFRSWIEAIFPIENVGVCRVLCLQAACQFACLHDCRPPVSKHVR